MKKCFYFAPGIQCARSYPKPSRLDSPGMSWRSHPEILRGTVQSLAKCLARMQRPADAEFWFRQTLVSKERTRSSDHPEVVSALEDLGICLGQSLAWFGRLVLPCIIHALSKRDHIKISKAVCVCVEVVEILQQTSKLTNFPTVYHGIFPYHQSFLRLGRLEEAEVFLRRAHDILYRTLGKLHPHRSSALRNLGICRSDEKHCEMIKDDQSISKPERR